MSKRKLFLFLIFASVFTSCAFYTYGQNSPCDSITVYFDLNSVEIQKNTISSNELMQFIESVKNAYNDGRLQHVCIYGSSCLMGNSVICEASALRRAESLRNYIIQNADIPDGLVTITDAGIDWNLLATLVSSDSRTPKRDIVVKTIKEIPVWIFDSNNHVVDGRKKQLMEIYYGRSFAYMREHFFSDMRYASARLYCGVKDNEAPVAEAETMTEDSGVSKADTAHMERIAVEDTGTYAVTDTTEAEETDTAYSGPVTIPAHAKKEMTWEGSNVWLKTDIPYWALLVANLGVEVRLSDHWSLDIPVMYSPYTVSPSFRFRIFAVQPSARYWLRADMTGHFFGIHAMGGMFNLSVNDSRRFQDINGAWGGGIDYGYTLRFSKHWGMEFNIGVGYLWSKYETFYNIENGASYNRTTLNYFGITRLGISLIYKL